MSVYVFHRASRYGAETWYGGRGWTPKAQEHIFKVTPPIEKGHPEVKLLWKCPWPPNLVGRTPDQSVTEVNCIAGVKGHVGVNWGQIA